METTQNRTGFNRMVCDMAADGGRIEIDPSDQKEWLEFMYVYNGSVGLKATQFDKKTITTATSSTTTSSVMVFKHDAVMVENIERLSTNNQLGQAIGKLRPGDRIELFIPEYEIGPGVQYARVICSARAKPKYMYNVQKTKTGCIVGLNSTVKVSARERINEMLKEYEQPIHIAKVLSLASINTVRNYVADYNDKNDVAFVVDTVAGLVIKASEYNRPSGHVDVVAARAAMRRVELGLSITQADYDDIKRGFQEVLNKLKAGIK